jgi:hypothetical protein
MDLTKKPRMSKAQSEDYIKIHEEISLNLLHPSPEKKSMQSAKTSVKKAKLLGSEDRLTSGNGGDFGGDMQQKSE